MINKTKEMSAVILMYIFSSSLTLTSKASIFVCNGQDRARAIQNLVYCAPRDQLVTLTKSTTSINLTKIKPGHALVKRCGGSCWASPHTCRPLETKNSSIVVTGTEIRVPYNGSPNNGSPNNGSPNNGSPNN